MEYFILVYMWRSLALALVLIPLLFPGIVFSEMTSTSYSIRNDSFVQAGGFMGSDNYGLFANVGEVGAGATSSDSYQVNAGLIPGYFAEVVKFTIFGLDVATEVGALSYSDPTLTVTDASDFVEADQRSVYGALFENKGTDNEEVHLGFLSAASTVTDTVTFAEDGNIYNSSTIGSSGTGPQVDGNIDVDGVNDYFYRFITPVPAQALGEVSSTLIASTAYMFHVESDDDLGYKIFASIPNARDDLLDYPGVADGHVSVGDAEWGGRSSDTSLSDTTFDTADTAITAIDQQIAQRSQGKLNDTDYFVVRVAASADDYAGESYAGNIRFTLVGGY